MGTFRGAVVIAAGTLAAGLSTSVASAGADEFACAREPKAIAAFVSGEEIPESVTTDEQGSLYVSVGNTIRKRAPGGAFGVFATLPLPINALGVKVGPDGCVYNVSTSLSAVPGAFVWRVCSANSVEVFAELDHSGAPNDLAFDERGNLFVTDPVLARIWRVDRTGSAQVFVQHPLLAGTPDNPALVFRALGVNGIALDHHQRSLFVSNTDQGSILRIDLRSAQPTPSVFAQDSRLRGADGIAFDRSKTLWVAVNALDSLVTVDQHARVRVRAQGGLLDAPSSVVFGATRQDRTELYLMSSAFSRTLGLQPGTPQPALLSLRAESPGLPLP
jgi:sugar lactone lactonase YvrE